MKTFKIEPFNDHQNCKGHANFMLDCTYEKKEDRDNLAHCLTNYIDETDNLEISKR